MKDNAIAILTLIVVLMYAVGIILFFVNMFDGSSYTRVKIISALLVGATVLGGITKAFSKNNDSDS